MSDVLKKVQDLIARATHETTPLEEQRNSALAAVKLITKHQLTVTDRPPLPVVDVNPDEILKGAREAVADDVTSIASAFAKDGFAGVVDWFGATQTKVKQPHTKVRGTKKNICANCYQRLEPGDELMVETSAAGLHIHNRKPRITCLKDACVRTWG